MYPVSETFLQAVQENTRSYYWTGKITTKAGVEYAFGAKDIVKGSGYISRQCCGSTEMELGTVYAAEMGITIFSDIDRYTLEDASISLSYHLKFPDGSGEKVPMGIFEVSEENRLVKCSEIKAYDYMLRFDKSFNGFETVGTAWDFINLCCKTCKVDPEQSEDEIKAMEEGFSTAVVDGMTGFIFTNRFGTIHNPQAINRAIKRIYEAHNAEEILKAKNEHRDPVIIPHFSCHHMRHTFCTRFCENETNVKVIQSIMGHASIETTMDIYAEVTRAKKKEALDNLSANLDVF